MVRERLFVIDLCTGQKYKCFAKDQGYKVCFTFEKQKTT